MFDSGKLCSSIDPPFNSSTPCAPDERVTIHKPGRAATSRPTQNTPKPSQFENIPSPRTCASAPPPAACQAVPQSHCESLQSAIPASAHVRPTSAGPAPAAQLRPGLPDPDFPGPARGGDPESNSAPNG